ncbi:capsule biosynthesis protein [Roseococcus sp. DSY-14]|uniref:capsule biosynthesis protein n=1 Tax=Roseococcus sp. DSY-14 TaxID=3369650 RepID=UPI00387A97F7
MKIWTKLSPPTAPSEGQAEQAAPPPSLLRRLPLPARQREGAARLRDEGDARPVLRPAPGGAGVLRRHPFALAVLLPTLLTALYLFVVAAPQYVSESRYLLRGQQRSATSLLGEALNQAGFRAAGEDTAGLRDFLLSHDAVRLLRQRLDLVGMFRRPEADPLLRLWWSEPEAERLLAFYRSQVSAVVDHDSGITAVKVRTFRPADSLELSRALLALGEERVNELNARLREESLRIARAELERAEGRARDAQAAVTALRQREQAVDPARAAAINVETLGRLEAELTRLRTELQQALAFARPNAPQVQSLRSRIEGAETQLAEERRRVAAAGTGVTERLGDFERLRLEGEFAARSLAAATAQYERALSDAQRQALFLVRVVEPNLAERSLYPRPALTTLYVFAGLSLVYGLGWLLVAGVREHAA